MNTAPSSLGREPPNSPGAEQSLLSACLLDDGQTLRRCLDNGISPGSFHLPAHRLVFDVLCQLQQAGQPVLLETLVEELRATEQLEPCGGMSWLLQMSEASPTTILAAHHIERVRTLAASRQLISISQSVIEGSLAGTLPPARALENFDRLREEVGFASLTLQERLAAALLNPDAEPPPGCVTFRVKNIAVSTPGNLTNITGLSKAGKTAFINAMLAATMGTDGDFLGVSSSNPAGKAVIHIDTEQSQRDHWVGFQTALRRAGLKTKPPWLQSYGVVGWSISERRTALEPILQLAKATNRGILALLIDGIADFVNDPNDGLECFGFVDSLQALAVKYGGAVVTGLHLNPSSGDTFKSRGHLGSHLERRAESNLILEKDAETGRTVVFSNGKQRHAPLLKMDAPCFKWSEVEQMHVSVETLRVEQDTAVAEEARLLAGRVFEGRGGLTHAALIDALKSTAKCSERTANRKFAQMRDHKAIEHFAPNLWALAK